MVSQQPAAAATQELRDAPRRPAAAVPSITSLRISPHGVEAALVNISGSGILAECSERLKPGSAVTVVFEGTFSPRTAEGRVARTTVSSMGKDGRLRYHVGISFTKPIALDPLVPEAAAPIPADVRDAGAPELNVKGSEQAGSDDSPSAKVETSGPALVKPTVRNRW